jgi:hypothetical protein
MSRNGRGRVAKHAFTLLSNRVKLCNYSPRIRVHPVDQKLARWVELYEQLKLARARLKAAAGEPEAVRAELTEQVHSLQRQCGVALDELQAEYARMKDPGNSTR